jgi:hypothetical protein
MAFPKCLSVNQKLQKSSRLEFVLYSSVWTFEKNIFRAQ